MMEAPITTGRHPNALTSPDKKGPFEERF